MVISHGLWQSRFASAREVIGQDILAHVFREGASLLGAGLGAGLVLALAATRLLASQLHGVGPQDPVAHLVAGGVLSLAAALACWLPARRAARVDPMVALRME